MKALTLEALENIVDVYARVSSQEQAEEGYSIGEQEEKLKAYCVAMGYKVNRVAVDPGYSGASLDRPGIKEVISDVKHGRCKKVIVWKLDRLSRSQKDTLILLEDVFFPNGCAFVSLNENFDTATPIGRCIVGVLAAFAQMERENIKARTMMGKQAAVRSGRFVASRIPIGYKLAETQGGKNEIEPDPYTSLIIKDIYRVYNSGASLCDVGRYIDQVYGCFSHITTNHGTRCGVIMRNPVYAGYVTIKGEKYKGNHEAIVSEAEWEAANYRLAQNVSFDPGEEKRTGLLTGILFCKKCGARMSARWWADKDRSVKRYICCSVSKPSRRMVKDPDCPNRKNLYRYEELDQIILEEIAKLSADPEAIDALMDANEKGGTEDKAEPLRERMKEVEKQITRLLNLYQAGVLELEEIQPRLSSLKEERASLAGYVEEIEAERPGRISKSKAIAISSAFPEAIARGSRAELSRLVRSLIDKVEVFNGEITIYWKFQ